MTFLFWFSVAFIAYVYAGYLLLLTVWCRRWPRDRRNRNGADPALPGVSIVIAARDESRRLAARIENLLALDYPAGRRQIIIALDGPADDSAEVLRRYAGSVDVVSIPRAGKAAALNAGVALAGHEILVFADARQTFAADALRQLVGPFSDETIGGVTGELVLDAEAPLFSNRRTPRGDRRRRERPGRDRRQGAGSTIADGVGLYWRYEKALRRRESAIGSTLGATGAIYAIRRRLWRDIPPETLLDDVLVPMRVVLEGYRVVFNDRARAFDRAAADADAETRRKIRTLAGNYQLVRLEPRLLLPWRNPVWLQFVSHKLGRLAVPYALLGTFAASVALSSDPFYLAALALQVAFYLLAGYGAWLEMAARRPPVESRSPAGPIAVREVA
jgi:biofilm PGA synthesis N-glycosyltransferase PgaC